MSEHYILSCESTVDWPYDEVAKRDIPVIFYKYTLDGKEYEDDMMRTEGEGLRFLKMMEDGGVPRTSQLNEFEYVEYLDKLLEKDNVIHITFSSGLTNSYANCLRAAEDLRKKHPDRKLIIVDSACGSIGYWMLVERAADMRDAGAGMEEVAAWVEANRLKPRHQFFATRLEFFRRSGRVSGPVSIIASILDLVPLMHLDRAGSIIAYSKVRGKKAAIRATAKAIIDAAEGGAEHDGTVYVCHTNCEELARQTADLISASLPKAKIKMASVGTIIASHCGPGTVVAFVMGGEDR